MSLLPFGDLPPYTQRRFVPEGIDWEDWDALSALYDGLEQRIESSESVSDLEQWLLAWGELSAALGEESTRRYIAMTTHTEDKEAEAAYLRYVEQISPKVKPRNFKLAQLYLEHPKRKELPQKRYEVLDRDIETDVTLFRNENIPLETEETRLGQQYQRLSGSLTVDFRGKEHTLIQMGKYLEEPDRKLRQEAWELTSKRRFEEAEQFEQFFDQLVELREKIASNAGFDNYRDYAFKDRGRFDYTPEDCLQFHDAIEQEFMPLVRELQAERKQKLGVDSLRPWDLAVDPENRPPLRPFEVVDELSGKTLKIFQRLDSELADGFKRMIELKLLDLDNRKGKAPGGYQSTLSEARLPFIFMNAVGVQRDVETMLHEAGHAFHALATQPEDLHAYRRSPLEFAEVASMSMELLGAPYLEEFYVTEEANRARKTHLEGVISFFPWMATVDAFQHWIYTHPGHTRKERSDAFVALMKRFGGDVDWSGYEHFREVLWHRQLHIFLSPFYYVEYGIAQLGALQIWRNSMEDRQKALDSYKSALRLGGSRPLPELFQTAGAKFRFDAKTIRPLAESIQDTLSNIDIH